jgi:ATP-binding cassette, subfamily B, bacterial
MTEVNVNKVPVSTKQLLPKWRERLNALSNIPPLFKMVWAAAPRIVVASLFSRTVAALIPVAMLAVTKVVIDSLYLLASRHRALPGSFWWLVALQFGLAGLGTVASRLIEFCDHQLADKYTRYISTRIMEHASSLDLTSFEDPNFYDKLDRARVQGTDRIALIQSSGSLLQESITTVSLAVSICLYSPWVLLALVVCIVPVFLGETYFAFLNYSLNFQQTTGRREMEYLRVIGGSKESAKELKLFGLSPFLVNRYKALSDAFHGQNSDLAKRRLLAGSALSLLGTIGYYGSYAFVIHQTVIGAISLGTLTFLAGAIAGASGNIQTVFISFSSIADQALFLTDLLEFFAVKPKVFSRPNALLVPRRILRGFEFRNVSFSYPNSTRTVLKDINFRLEPGERVALVGTNGQGKTTIVKLLTRLYDVTSGQILLDGVDIRDYDLESLWREIGVIFQDFMRYEMSASDNIAMGRIEERNNPSRIRSAALKSLADEVVTKLPDRYEQLLGCRFEGGVDLSGGEWQRIALGRAYLRDAQLLVLDEPTAALDARSEHEVFKRFVDLTANKMSLLISHRFSTVRMADRILVLGNGTISEQGVHEQLIKTGGSYAQMFELQASSYR